MSTQTNFAIPRMGLLKHVLFWPVTGPQFLVKYSMETIEDVVREELTDDQAIKEELMALQMRLELGEIDDDEYVENEALLMRRLREVRHWREEFGMGLSGGPVQVRRDEEPNVAEAAVAEPEDDHDEDDDKRGGMASSEGASVEVNLDWE